MQDTISEISVKSSHYIIGAAGLVAGMAWRDVLSAGLDRILPSDDAIIAKVINAVIITLLLIVMVMILPDTKDNLPTETQVIINDKKIKSHKKIINEQQKVIQDLREDISNIDDKTKLYSL